MTALTSSSCSQLSRRGRHQRGAQHQSGPGAVESDHPEIRELDSGTTVVSLIDDEHPQVTAQLWSPRGSAEEPPDHPSLAGLCAEAFCHGIPAPAGVEVEGWASLEATVCELRAPRALADDLTAHTSALLRPVANDTAEVDPGELCTEHLDRWRRSRGSPGRLLFESLFRAAFGEDHPYASPPLTAPSCDGPHIETLVETCRQWFAPEDLVVVTNLEQLGPRLEALLTDDRGANPPPLRPAPTPPVGPRALVVSAPVPSVQLAVAVRLEVPDPEALAAAHLTTELIADRSRVRRQRDSQRRGFVFDGRRRALAVVASIPSCSRLIEEADELLSALFSLRRRPPMAEELARARGRALDRMRSARQGTTARLSALGLGAALHGSPTRLSEAHQALARDEVDLELDRFVQSEDLVIVALVPEHLDGADDPSSLPRLVTDGQQRIDRAAIRARLVELITAYSSSEEQRQWEATAQGISRLELPQGPTVAVRPERHATLVTLRVAVPVEGRELDGHEVGALAALRRALRQRLPPSITIQEERRSLALEATFPTEQLDQVTAEVLTALLAPELPVGDEGVPLEADRGSPTPIKLGRAALTEALDLEEPWLWSAVDGQEPTSWDEVRALHRDLVHPDRVVVSLVGPVDLSSAAWAIEAAVLPYQSEGVETAPAAQRPTSGHSGLEIRREVAGERTDLLLGFPSPGLNDPSWAALHVARELLDGENSQAALRLVAEGLAGEVGVELELGALSGHLAVHAVTVRDNEREVLAILRQILDELRDGQVTSFELEVARRRAAAALSRGLASAAGRAEAIERALLADLPASTLLDAPSHVLGLSNEAILAVIGRVMSADHEVVVVVGAEPPETEAADTSQDTEEASEESSSSQ